MPRARPFTCRKCGREYTGARCPRCYPSKQKRRGGSRRGGLSGGKARIDWGRVLRGPQVNVEAVPSDEDDSGAAGNGRPGALRGGDPEDELSAMPEAGTEASLEGGAAAGAALQPAAGAQGATAQESFQYPQADRDG